MLSTLDGTTSARDETIISYLGITIALSTAFPFFKLPSQIPIASAADTSPNPLKQPIRFARLHAGGVVIAIYALSVFDFPWLLRIPAAASTGAIFEAILMLLALLAEHFTGQMGRDQRITFTRLAGPVFLVAALLVFIQIRAKKADRLFEACIRGNLSASNSSRFSNLDAVIWRCRNWDNRPKIQD